MEEIKFTVEMPALRKHVNFVRNGLGASKTDLPVMIFRFEVVGSKLIIFAANKEMFCRTEMKVTNEGENGTFSVLGGKIVNLTQQIEAETAYFEADQENLKVVAGFLSVNFETYDGSVLRTIEAGLQDHLKEEGIAVVKAGFEEALTCAKSCITTNSIRPDVTHMEIRKKRGLSSDGRKIMIYQHDGFPEELNFKCPASTINEVIGAVKNMDVDNVAVVEGNAYFYVKGEKNKYTMGIRKVERQFPAVESQMLTVSSPSDEVSIDKNVLETMLRGVALGLPSDEVKVVIDIRGEGREAYLEVSATNNLGRRSHERSSCGRKGTEPLSFPISFKHLIETLAVFKGDSVVDLIVLQKLNMAMVKDSTTDREVTTIVPYRTDKQIEQEKADRAAAEKALAKERQEAVAERDQAKDAALSALDDGPEVDLELA